MSKQIIGVVGAGAMGSGIAQIAATAGHKVVLFDTNSEALKKSEKALLKVLNRLIEKGKISEEKKYDIHSNIEYATQMDAFSNAYLIIEAIVEKLDVKQSVFKKLESIVSIDCVLASNTSSLSIASIASACEHKERIIGLHFFNPAPLLPLVEVVPSLLSDQKIIDDTYAFMKDWGKIPVIAKDTPGFIVNRVARPFYGEAIRIYEEGFADFATIDWALKELGGFRMGPFELMDLIGNDVNYAVTETVFKEFYYDPRYRPSFTQKRRVEAGMLGRKSGRGYYDYTPNAEKPSPKMDKDIGREILDRVIVMLVNEAVDALFLNVATPEDIDLAMTKGVNYPKGLLAWCDDLGADRVLYKLDSMYEEYREDRYRPSPLLRRIVMMGDRFFD